MVNQDAAQKFLKQGLTFDDVLLIPAASDEEDPSEYPADQRRHGYRDGVPHGHRHRP